MHAKSKWFFPNGEHEVKPCIVTDYNKEEERFEIQWAHSGATKLASRFNTIFDKEDENMLNFRLKVAKEYREISELIMHYNSEIDHLKGMKVTPMNEELKSRIASLIESYSVNIKNYRDVRRFLTLPAADVYKISKSRITPRIIELKYADTLKKFESLGYNLDSLRNLYKEVEGDYERSQMAFDFELTLPYSGISTFIIDKRRNIKLTKRYCQKKNLCQLLKEYWKKLGK